MHKQRKDFEKWCKTEFNWFDLDKRGDDAGKWGESTEDYCDQFAKVAWAAWQAEQKARWAEFNYDDPVFNGCE